MQQPHEPLSPESLQRIQTARGEAEAVSTVMEETAGLFHGYYFVSKDGYVLGLCTGMRVRV